MEDPTEAGPPVRMQLPFVPQTTVFEFAVTSTEASFTHGVPSVRGCQPQTTSRSHKPRQTTHAPRPNRLAIWRTEERGKGAPLGPHSNPWVVTGDVGRGWYSGKIAIPTNKPTGHSAAAASN